MEILKDPKKKHKLIMGASALFSFAMSIYSFVNCLGAQQLLDQNTDDYTNVVKNWQALPLLDAKVIAKGSPCPSGYEEGVGYATKANKYTEDKSAETLQSVAVWPGTKAHCICSGSKHPNGRKFQPKIRNIKGCTGGQKKKGKTTISCASSIKCTLNQLNAGCKHDYGPWELGNIETFVDTKRKCNSNETLAGCVTEVMGEKKLNYFKGKKVCYKRGGLPAMDRPKVKDEKCPDNAVKCGEAKDLGVYCADKKEHCPITTLNSISASSFAVKDETKRPIVEVRMTQGKMCEHGEEGIKDREGYTRYAHNNRYPCNYKPSAPSKYDPDNRYEVFDSTDEVEMFTNNNVDKGGKSKMPAVTAKTFGTYKLPETLTEDSTPEFSLINNPKQKQYKYYLSFRRELKWNANCSAGTIQDLKSKLSPVQQLAGQQRALVGLNGFFGLFILGIVFPITVLMFIFDKDSDLPCIPGSGEEEEKNIKKAKTVCGTIAKIAKFIPLILAYSTSGSVMKFFSVVGSAKCSDSETNEIFSFLGKEIGKVNQKNQNTLIADVLMLIVAILTALYSKYKASKKKTEGGQELSDIKVDEGPKNSWVTQNSPAVAEVSPQQSLQQQQIQQQQAILMQQQQQIQAQQAFIAQQGNLAAQGFKDVDGDGVISQEEVNAQIQMQYEAQMSQPDSNKNEVSITVPKGYGPGKALTIKTASGKKVKVKIPDGKMPGMTFTVDMALLESVAK